MANKSIGADRLIDRRNVLRVGATLAAAGPALLRGTHAEAQPRPGRPTPIIDSQVYRHRRAQGLRFGETTQVWNWHVSSVTL
jgi:hypothetical protein